MIPAHQSPLPSQSNTIDQEEIDALVSKGYTVEQAIAVCQTSRSTSHDNVRLFLLNHFPLIFFHFSIQQ